MAGFRGGFGGGFGGGNNMQALVRQAQKMQEDMKKAQEELEEMQIEGIAMNGLVKVIMNGKKVISAINVSPDAVDEEDMTMLEDLIIVAINDGYAKADKAYNEKMGAFSGMGL